MIIKDNLLHKHRIFLSTSFKELKKNDTLHAQIPLYNGLILKNQWINLVIDLNDISLDCFNQTFNSLEQITLGSYCHIKRIFTINHLIMDNNHDLDLYKSYGYNPLLLTSENIPKSLDFIKGVSYKNQIFSIEKINAFLSYISCNKENINEKNRYRS